MLTAPVRGIPPSAALQSGVPAASTFYKSLADADDAALMRLFIELRILVNDGKHVDQMHIGNDIQLYTDTRITDHFLPSSFKSFNRCTYILQFHVPPVTKTHHIFSRNRLFARKPCVAAQKQFTVMLFCSRRTFSGHFSCVAVRDDSMFFEHLSRECCGADAHCYVAIGQTLLHGQILEQWATVAGVILLIILHQIPISTNSLVLAEASF